MVGGAGDDTLIGGAGKDDMTGGPGKDVFVFLDETDSTVDKAGRDIIRDFKSGEDKIDLSQFSVGSSGSGQLHFIGGAAFSTTDATGEIRFEKGVLYVSTDATPDAEFAVTLNGVNTLTVDDFIL